MKVSYGCDLLCSAEWGPEVNVKGWALRLAYTSIKVLSGGIEALRSIPTIRIASIRLVDRSDPESSRIVGGAHAILVSTIWLGHWNVRAV